jgi:hypothetical protein
MSRDTYHALIIKHYSRSISAPVAMIGGEEGRDAYTTCILEEIMANLSIIPFARMASISKGSASNTSTSISVEVV